MKTIHPFFKPALKKSFGLLIASSFLVFNPFAAQAAAPTATTVAATLITSTGATLNSTVNPNGLSTTIYFQYGLTAS